MKTRLPPDQRQQLLDAVHEWYLANKKMLKEVTKAQQVIGVTQANSFIAGMCEGIVNAIEARTHLLCQ